MTDSYDRRTVLRTVGTASAVGVGAVGTASAACQTGESFYVGDVVQVCNPNGSGTDILEQGCPPSGQIGTAPEGAVGTVQGSCTDQIGGEWLYVDFRNYPTGWVSQYEMDQ